MLGRDRHHLPEAQPTEVLRRRMHLRRIDLVHGEEHRLAAADQQPRQLHIRARQLRPPVHHHHNRVRFLKRHLRLPKDLTRNQCLIVRHHAARIDQPNLASRPLHLAIDPVARNPRLIADDRPPRPSQPVEQCTLAYVRSPADRNQRQCPARRMVHRHRLLQRQQLRRTPLRLWIVRRRRRRNSSPRPT